MLIRGILGETALEQNNVGSWSRITPYREIAERTKSSDLFQVADNLHPPRGLITLLREEITRTMLPSLAS